MQPKTSRDLPPSPPRQDERREREQAAVKDADQSAESERDRVHGDGDAIDLDNT